MSLTGIALTSYSFFLDFPSAKAFFTKKEIKKEKKIFVRASNCRCVLVSVCIHGTLCLFVGVIMCVLVFLCIALSFCSF